MCLPACPASPPSKKAWLLWFWFGFFLIKWTGCSSTVVAVETRKHHLYFQIASPSSLSTVGCYQLFPLTPRSGGQRTRLACKGSGRGAWRPGRLRRISLKEPPPRCHSEVRKERLSHGWSRLRRSPSSQSPLLVPTHLCLSGTCSISGGQLGGLRGISTLEAGTTCKVTARAGLCAIL